ncbi:SLC26A7, partial [Cervus elaphus hippelaphus]
MEWSALCVYFSFFPTEFCLPGPQETAGPWREVCRPLPGREVNRLPPKRLAFAVLSSVHPVFGLYGSLFPAIIYAIFGMGRHVATGTFALTSLISANAVERLVPLSSQNLTTHSNTSVLGLSDFEMQRISVAAAVSFLGGVIQVAMFVLQLGSATFLITEPV